MIRYCQWYLQFSSILFCSRILSLNVKLDGHLWGTIVTEGTSAPQNNIFDSNGKVKEFGVLHEKLRKNIQNTV